MLFSLPICGIMGWVMKMDKEKDLPKRKDLRLKHYDYSSAGAYFVTICTKDRKRILSNIIKPSVGVGALDDPLNGFLNEPQIPQIQLTEIGKVTEKYLLSSENIPGVKIDRYVIMPDHIHVIIFLYPDKYTSRKDGSSRAPTPTNEMLPHIVSTFKRFCNREIGNNIFQRGYMEHIVRDREDYETRAKYIYENPIRWYYDKLNSEK
jgi:REP element-mobilizing transposase RayT